MKTRLLTSSLLLLALLLAACGTDTAPQEADPLGEPGWYTMRNAQTALCLVPKIDWYGYSDLSMATCDHKWGDQNFRLEHTNGSIGRQLVNRVLAGKCVWNPEPNHLGFHVCPDSESSPIAQRGLTVEQSGDGLRYKFEGTDRCLGVDPNERGTPVSRPCDGSAEQQWVIQYLGY